MTLIPMKLVHEDGTVFSFQGCLLQNDKDRISRFIYSPLAVDTLSIVIWFDNNKKRNYWECSCGGKSLPYHTCQHLKDLGLSLQCSVIVLSEEYINNPTCIRCGKKLKKTSGFCGCGVINANYEGYLQRLGLSTGLSGGGNIEDETLSGDVQGTDFKITFTFLCPDCKKPFESSNAYGTCPSCPMATPQLHSVLSPKKYQCSSCGITGDSINGFQARLDEYLNPIFFCQGCDAILYPSKPSVSSAQIWIDELEKKDSTITVKYRDWDQSYLEKSDDDQIPKLGKKRIFADKDEDI